MTALDVSQNEVDMFISTLRAKGTPWGDGCASLVNKLWTEVQERRIEVEKYKAWAASCDPAPPAPPTSNERTFRCFHCDEVFTGVDAENHFGRSEAAEPACKIKAAGEFALLMALRNAEEELNRYRSEDSDVLRAMHSMIADHQVALRREEEKGYERGLRDARSQGETQAPLTQCPYCKRPARDDGSIFHEAGCAGLEPVHINQLEYDRLVPQRSAVKAGAPHPSSLCTCGPSDLHMECPAHGAKARSTPCEHLRSELLAEKRRDDRPLFEMRKCLDCRQIFRVRSSLKTSSPHDDLGVEQS